MKRFYSVFLVWFLLEPIVGFTHQAFADIYHRCGGTRDLRTGTSKQSSENAYKYGSIETCTRAEARRNTKGQGQGQGYNTGCDPTQQISSEIGK